MQTTLHSFSDLVSTHFPSLCIQSMEIAGSEADDTAFNSLFRLELGFYEVLKIISKRTKIYLTLPETFIFGFGFPQPSLLCTDYATGELHIRENITKAGVYEACGFFEDLANGRTGVPVAVHKLAATTYFKDVVTPQFSGSEAFSTWTKYISMSRAQVLQRYLLCGFHKASLIKAIWTGDSVKKQEFANPTPMLSQSASETNLNQTFDSPTRDFLRRKFLVITRNDTVKCSDIAVSHSIDSKVRYLVALLEKYYLPSAEFKVARLEVDFMQDRKGVR